MFSIIVLFNWICVVLFVLGFIGNLLGFVVFSSRRFRCCSTYATLALTSFTINFICIIRYSLLLHSSTRKWLSDYLVSYHWLTCKIFRLSSAIRVLAAWVTVFWVIERFLYVSIRLNLFAYRRERFARLEKYKYFGMISLCLLMTIVVTGPTVYFYAPIPISFNDTHSIIQCTFNYHELSPGWQRYFVALNFGWNYHTIRFLLSELIPSILVALFNIAIIICIIQTTAHVRRRRQESHYNHQLSISMSTGVTSKLPPVFLPLYETNQRSYVRTSTVKSSFQPMKSIPMGKMSWMNIVLILHSFLFFLSSTITSLVYFSTSNIILAYWISVIILANCSLNFYIYCLSGEQFRTELKRIATRYRRHMQKRCFRLFCCERYEHRRRHSSLHHQKKDPSSPRHKELHAPTIR